MCADRAQQHGIAVTVHRRDHEFQTLQRAPCIVGRAPAGFELFDRAPGHRCPHLRSFQVTLRALEIEPLPLKVRHAMSLRSERP
jgi:hypothetical protein